MTAGRRAVVGVCGVARCEDAVDRVLDVLRPMVSATPDAVLLRIADCPLHGRCRHESGARVVVQSCSATMRPTGSAAVLLADDSSSWVRTVSAWMKAQRIIRGRRVRA